MGEFPDGFWARIWRDNRQWLAIVTVFVLLSHLMMWLMGHSIKPVTLMDDAVRLCAAMALPIFGVFILVVLARQRPEAPLKFLTARARKWRLPERLAGLILVVIAVRVFMSNFSTVKMAIPEVVPYYLDPLLLNIDLRLHGGPPWRLLVPWLGSPPAILAMSMLYDFWWIALFAVLLCVAAAVDRPQLRAQYITAFFLCWIVLGTVAAYLLASVGPCYYDAIYGGHHFAPQMRVLQDANQVFRIESVHRQAALWDALMRRDYANPYGVSAMPSLHVSMATLIAILGWKLNRWFAAAGTVFLLAIMAGSVLLRWHYAVDGYVAVIGTVATWKLSGWLVLRRSRAAISSSQLAGAE